MSELDGGWFCHLPALLLLKLICHDLPCQNISLYPGQSPIDSLSPDILLLN